MGEGPVTKPAGSARPFSTFPGILMRMSPRIGVPSVDIVRWLSFPGLFPLLSSAFRVNFLPRRFLQRSLCRLRDGM